MSLSSLSQHGASDITAKSSEITTLKQLKARLVPGTKIRQTYLWFSGTCDQILEISDTQTYDVKLQNKKWKGLTMRIRPNIPDQPCDDPRIEETRLALKHIFDKTKELEPLFEGMTRDKLLELWRAGNDDVCCQFTLMIILNERFNTPVPLMPYDIRTDKERFAIQPDSIIARVHQAIHERVQTQANDFFRTAERDGFPLPEHVKTSLMEQRLQRDMTDGGFAMWKSMHRG